MKKEDNFDGFPAELSQLISDLKRKNIAVALDTLPGNEQVALISKFVLDFEDREIAAMLGLGLTDARQCLANGITHFRKAYVQHVNDKTNTPQKIIVKSCSSDEKLRALFKVAKKGLAQPDIDRVRERLTKAVDVLRRSESLVAAFDGLKPFVMALGLNLN